MSTETPSAAQPYGHAEFVKALQHETIIIDSPELPHHGAVETPLLHGYRHILKELKAENETLDFLVVMFTHAPNVTGEIIDEGVEALLAKPGINSAVSVSQYNFFNPHAARHETKEGELEPMVPAGHHRHGPQADVWYPDWGVFVLRPGCLDHIAHGPAHYPWMGKKSLPLKQWGGAPIEFPWQVPAAEYWLKAHNVSDLSPSLEMQPKPQPKASPKGDRR